MGDFRAPDSRLGHLVEEGWGRSVSGHLHRRIHLEERLVIARVDDNRGLPDSDVRAVHRKVVDIVKANARRQLRPRPDNLRGLHSQLPHEEGREDSFAHLDSTEVAQSIAISKQ